MIWRRSKFKVDKKEEESQNQIKLPEKSGY